MKDFRSRNPRPLFNNASLDAFRKPIPFRFYDLVQVLECPAPDQSVVFLSLTGKLTPDEGAIISYLVEANPDCPMRLAFERGEVSWPDYWFSRPWMIELKSSLCSDNHQARYIHPSEMDPITKKNIETYGERSPYEISKSKLERSILLQTNSGEDTTDVKRRYREFMIQYERVFAKSAA